MEKAKEVFVFSRIFIWELMGVTSGHGNPINRSRDRKTLPEEEVELDWGQKKQENIVGKAGGLAKKKKNGIPEKSRDRKRSWIFKSQIRQEQTAPDHG